MLAQTNGVRKTFDVWRLRLDYLGSSIDHRKVGMLAARCERGLTDLRN